MKTSSILRWTALAALLFTALLRAQSTRARLPYWDLDPTRVTIPETALLYSHGFLLDALVWLSAAAMIVGESLAGRRIHWKNGLLVLMGAIGVALHGYVLPPPGATPGGPLRGDFMGLALGSAWAAAMVGGWTILHLARDQAMRRAAALALFAFTAILVAKGAYQVYVEHAYTVSAYKKDPGGMLASQGLAAGSTAAKEYERRLFQPEPVAWFGLANVYATFVAAAFIFFLGLSVGAWKLVKQKTITSGAAGVVSLAALASLFGLYLSGSKGGWGAMLAGGAVLLVGSLSHSALRMGEDVTASVTGEGSVPPPSTSRSPSSGFFSRLLAVAQCPLPIALCAVTLLAIFARGAIGERLHELSLLFRSQYLIAAVRIFASEPIFGVGPMGFKNAYALHKVPINPEMVESPHSVFFDWSATLGLFGVAWCAVLIWILFRVGSGLSSRPKTQDSSPAPLRSLRPVLIAVVLASATAWLREAPVVTLDEWPLRLIALGISIVLIVIGARIAALAPRAFTLALAAAATTGGVHSMIEMTPTQPGSCAWVMLVIAIAGAALPLARTNRTISPAIAAFHAMALAMLLIFSARTSFRWEHFLHVASLEASSAREARARVGEYLAEAHGLTLKPDELPSIHRQNLYDALREQRSVLRQAARTLRLDAAPLVNMEFQTLERAIMLDSEAAELDVLIDHHMGDNWPDRFATDYAIELDDRISWHVTRARVYDTAAQHNGNTPYPLAALWSWRRITQLDPYSLTPALNAYRLALDLNDFDTAYQMAELALRNNEYLRLDPLKQLDPAQVAELKAFLASEAPNPDQTTPSEPVNPAPPT